MKSLLLLLTFVAPLFAAPIVFICCGHSNMENFYARNGEKIFISTLSQQYPGQTFKTIRMAFASTTIKEMVNGDSRFNNLLLKITSKRDSVKFGGLIMMYGILEGKDSSVASDFSKDANIFIRKIRLACNNPKLPVFFGRYEINADSLCGPLVPFRKYCYIVDKNINDLSLDRNIYLCPLKYMTKDHFIECHHYNEEGQKIFANDLIFIIQNNKLDFWSN